jgi:hypothetical protein
MSCASRDTLIDLIGVPVSMVEVTEREEIDLERGEKWWERGKGGEEEEEVVVEGDHLRMIPSSQPVTNMRGSMAVGVSLLSTAASHTGQACSACANPG